MSVKEKNKPKHEKNIKYQYNITGCEELSMADSDAEFLELEDFLILHDSLLSYGHSKQSTSAEDLQREWALRVIALPLHQYMLVLFDGDRQTLH